MPQSDRYEDRPPLADIIERADEAEVRRWWPKMSGRDRAEVRKGVTLRSADVLGWHRFFLSASDESDEDVPLDPAEEHCARVAARRDVQLWNARLQRVLAAMPEGVWILVGDERVTVYAYPPNADECEVSPDLELEGWTPERVMTHKHGGFTGR